VPSREDVRTRDVVPLAAGGETLNLTGVTVLSPALRSRLGRRHIRLWGEIATWVDSQQRSPGGKCLALGLAGKRSLLCSEGDRHQPAPLLTSALELATARRRIAVVRHERSVHATTQGCARQTTRERKMDTTTLLVIVLVVLLVGGGGYFYKRRV